MKTVGDFKKLGGVVVAGDDLHENPTPVAHRWSKEINACGSFDRYTIKSFEWRANVGFAPSFVGEVEYELRNGEKGVCPITMLIFSLLGPNTNPCIKWRPHLDLTHQTVVPSEKMKIALNEAGYIARGFIDRCVVVPSKERPMFTQAMADAGELPPVESDVMVNVQGRGDYKAIVIGSYQRWVWLDVCGIGLDTYDIALVHPIDTRTDKEKAIDAAVSCLEDETGYTDSKHVEFCRILYRAGLLKL